VIQIVRPVSCQRGLREANSVCAAQIGSHVDGKRAFAERAAHLDERFALTRSGAPPSRHSAAIFVHPWDMVGKADAKFIGCRACGSRRNLSRDLLPNDFPAEFEAVLICGRPHFAMAVGAYDHDGGLTRF